MSWFRKQWRGRESVEVVFMAVALIVALPFAVNTGFLLYAEIFDPASMPEAVFTVKNFAAMLRDLPVPLALAMALYGASLFSVPFAAVIVVPIIGVHQLIAMTRSGGGPGGMVRRMGSALRRAVSHVIPPRPSQRTVTAHA